MNETLSVSAIKNGTVIDHITSGQALRIIHLLALRTSKHTMTIGMHLPSKSMGSKDLIKIENRILTPDEANEVVVFSPSATINIIENYTVIEKIRTHFPNSIKNVFACANSMCVSQTESIDSYFFIAEKSKKVMLTCYYCEKEFDRDQIKLVI